MAASILNIFSKHLSPDERLGELMFGLIMTLTFTLTAGFVVGEEPSAVRELLVATIGCNIAWGIIDGGLLVLGRAFERGRLERLGRVVRTLDHSAAAKAVGDELSESVGPLLSEEQRDALYSQIAERVRSTPPVKLLGVQAGDWWAAHGVFWLVVFASFPAAAPFLFIDEPWLAIRVSNAILLALFFIIGYYWAGYTNINRWLAATSITLFGMAMVITAVIFGG